MTASSTGENQALVELWIGTVSGLFRLVPENRKWQVREHLLGGEDIQVIARIPRPTGALFAGTYGHGLLRSGDGGKTWSRGRIEEDFIRAIVFSSSEPNTVYVGTEPANLYRSRDGGLSWENLNIRRLTESKHWSLPYSPRSGALRTLITQSGPPEKILGGVEQGGVIRSSDSGADWTISKPEDIPPDVHFLAGDAVNHDKFFAATGDGTYLSIDGAESWRMLWSDYTRAVLVHPTSPNLVFAGPARDVGEGGSILFSQDGGNTWAEAHNGRNFPLSDMVEFFVVHSSIPELVFAVLSEGEIIFSEIDRIEWRALEPRIEKVQFLEISGSALSDAL